MRPRRVILAVGVLAATLAGAGAASGETVLIDGVHEVLWVADNLAYVGWSAPHGARPGARLVFRDPGSAAVDTLEVVWVHDAIAAVRPLGPGGPPRRGTGLVEIAADPVPTPPRGLLRVPYTGGAEVLDPLYVTTLPEKQVVTQIFAGLVSLDASLAPEPALAAKWTTEGRRYTFVLRADARFHDGRPITARDVRATLERALSAGANAPRVEGLAAALEGGAAFREGRADAIAGVRVIDARTIELTAASPRASLLAELAAPAAFVVPAGTPPRPMDEPTLLAAQSGPFYVTGASEQAIHLAAAPDRDRGGPAAIDFVRVDGPSDAAVEFELGRLDLVAPPRAIASRLRAAGDTSPVELTTDEVATYYIGFDVRRPFLADRAHRRALAGLVDRALAVRVLAPGRGRLATGLLPPGFNPPSPPESLWAMPRAAAEAAARANFGGAAPELAFWIPSGSDVGLRLGEYVAAVWRRSGIRVRIVEQPWPEFRRGIAAGEADVFYWSWFADGPDPIAFLAAMVESTRSGDGGNRTHYANPDVDRAIAAARAAASDFGAQEALRRAELLALADAPLVPLFHPINVTLVRPGISRLLLDPLGAPRYDTVEVR